MLMPFFIVAMFLSVLTEFLLIVSRSLWVAASWSTMGLMVSAGGGFRLYVIAQNDEKGYDHSQ